MTSGLPIPLYPGITACSFLRGDNVPFAILEAESEESRRRFTAEAQAAAHRFMNSPPISKEEFMKDRGKAIRERYGIDPNEPTNRELLLPTELPGLGDL